MRTLNIAIDADGSPSGYITWHNHFTNKSKIRTVRPSIKNERFGVQRMEMLAIYFAIVDNLRAFKKLKRTRQIIIVRSDSKSTIEQLNEKTEIKDNLIQRIYRSIKRMLDKVTYTIVFNYQSRTENLAGKIIENIYRERCHK
ncbi:MAG: reverse transcriptase-like protein [Thermoproteota archaeon]|nr:reverse transcriptase-like protein [Thermoproteota archaeon]